MAMPAPPADDPRWSLELAGGALMDLGCYGLHIMRQAGPTRRSSVRMQSNAARASTRGATSHSLFPAGRPD